MWRSREGGGVHWSQRRRRCLQIYFNIILLLFMKLNNKYYSKINFTVTNVHVNIIACVDIIFIKYNIRVL